MTDEKPPHKAVWIVNANESVFGLKLIHAVMDCKVCGERKGPGQVLPYTDFRMTGEKIRRYTLLEDKCPTISH